VKPRKQSTSRTLKMLVVVGTVVAAETVTLRDIRLTEFDKSSRIEE